MRQYKIMCEDSAACRHSLGIEEKMMSTELDLDGLRELLRAEGLAIPDGINDPAEFLNHLHTACATKARMGKALRNVLDENAEEENPADGEYYTAEQPVLMSLESGGKKLSLEALRARLRELGHEPFDSDDEEELRERLNYLMEDAKRLREYEQGLAVKGPSEAEQSDPDSEVTKRRKKEDRRLLQENGIRMSLEGSDCCATEQAFWDMLPESRRPGAKKD